MLPPPIWQKAASFAAWKHRHQIRKDNRTPYIAHPFRVAMTVRDIFGCDDPVALCAALLHDTIEDTQTDYEEIVEHFSVELADIVAALTKNMALPESLREPEYDARLARADWRARLVKLGDVFDNLCDLWERTPERLDEVHGKCRRAMGLARADAAQHACTARAMQAVEDLMRG